MPAIPDIRLDHVAVAVEDQTTTWPRYAGDLPARWVGGGATPGFWSAQVEYANGMKVEVLEPYEAEANDFLRRFLDRNGPGPHHLTFKVKDLARALETVETAGYRPVGVDLSHPFWKEAFLHPKDAPGIVVQLAQSIEGGEWGDDKTPEWFPSARVADRAVLVHVAHAVADAVEAERLFVDVLGGTIDAEGRSGGLSWVDATWPGPGRVRLLAGEPLSPWLAGRADRVHHLAFAVADPGDVDGAEPMANGVFQIDPGANNGVRLLLATTTEPFAGVTLG